MKIPDKYIFNVLFLYIYIRKYNDLLDVCIKHIGGKIYSNDRRSYEHLDASISKNAINCLLQIIDSLEYSNDEFLKITYKIKANNTYDVIFIDTINYYSMGDGNLFDRYKSHIQRIIKDIFDLQKKLSNNSSSISYSDVLDIFLFSENGFLKKSLTNKNLWMFKLFMDELLLNNNVENSVLKYNLKKLFPIIIKNKTIDFKVKVLLKSYIMIL